MSKNYGSRAAASLKRLYSSREPLTTLAENLVINMGGELPDEKIIARKLYHLKGKTLHGVDALVLLVIPDVRAICIDLSSGEVRTVDAYGVESETQIGGRYA